ncbi:helix-turn-helix domain-containing protein [Terriglobus aquaticus]|uniref:Helix-turn-helix domain-containing protein n=1 Tax=Terriglobus aquaticus TaxID=940139 RepID=A0ABW9KGS9_9BACT|nr:helix-turn-helix domain-containing protein [Terriglobus aquaticus]
MGDLKIDEYVHSVLLRDLVGHDHRPAAFLTYLWLTLEEQRRGDSVAISYASLAEELGISRSAAQTAIAWLLQRKLLTVQREHITATPVYTTHQPWSRLRRDRSI